MSFTSAYQGGRYFEVFSTQGKDSGANWKVPSSGAKRLYEKDIKGYVLCLEGAPATTKIQSPKDSKQSLTLVQRFLVVQLYLSKGADFSMELNVSDLSNNKRRILLSSAQKEVQVTPLHAKVPLSVVKRAVWLNLVLDMVSLVGETWTSQTFRSVDQITVSANCKLRRVFTMKCQPPDTTDDDELYGCSSSVTGERDLIPKQCQMAPDVTQHTQLLTLNKIKCAERARSGKGGGLADQIRPGSMLDLDLNASGRKVQTSDGKIAFGSKAPRAPADSGRRTARQGSLTTRSFRSQTSRVDSSVVSSAGSSSDAVNSREDLLALGEGGDMPQPHPPATGGPSSALYSRQQSEPIYQDDGSYMGFNGFSENGIVAPHPPREPSNDRVRRRPRVKSMSQTKGDPNLASPPTSAMVSLAQHTSANSPNTAHMGQRSSEIRAATRSSLSSMSRGTMKDSGVGPDVPEIQSPRKGDSIPPSDASVFSERDSVSDVIALLREERGAGVDLHKPHEILWRNNDIIEETGGKDEVDKKKKGLDEARNGQNDSNVSSSASEGSNPGEYEDSDDENSGENAKLHLFVSPPKSAPRRNISPGTADGESHQTKKSFVKNFRSNIRRAMGARPEDDFVSRSSSDDESGAAGDAVQHILRLRKHTGNPDAGGLSRNHQHGFHHHHHRSVHHHPQHHIANHQNPSQASSGYNSSIYSSSAKSEGDKAFGLRPRPADMVPKTSVSPDQKPTFNPRAYADPECKGQEGRLSSMSRVSRRSLREITNPHTESGMKSPQKTYDHTRYQMADDLTESFEARMFASMRRQGDESMEDASPRPNRNSQTLRNSQLRLHPNDSASLAHMCSESPATTSDDDTSFSTWKAPNKAAHNYMDEMKSRRSSDTLTSSNPQDWSGVISPPIVGVQDLQGTLEGIPDELSDEAAAGPHLVKYVSDEEKLDVIFDPKLNCYFDPKTLKYYELQPS